jgi:hypothetical protein
MHAELTNGTEELITAVLFITPMQPANHQQLLTGTAK